MAQDQELQDIINWFKAQEEQAEALADSVMEFLARPENSEIKAQIKTCINVEAEQYQHIVASLKQSMDATNWLRPLPGGDHWASFDAAFSEVIARIYN